MESAGWTDVSEETVRQVEDNFNRSVEKFVFPMRHEPGFYISNDGILQNICTPTGNNKPGDFQRNQSSLVFPYHMAEGTLLSALF
jgi:hypothetical protein